MGYYQGFPNSGKEWEEIPPPPSMEESEFYWGGGIILPGEGNLRMSNFDISNFFPS